ncbi:hypothetical protein TorRG33x02_175170 [Trema orientale]|uniref:Uncharacterized protein n=1 Tax=Trema orientale TaxID=63057 RepID=A0A2P5EMI7_TREOI|nr:hypothetical protein TorRG33x02_175170 [Trema orientale]
MTEPFNDDIFYASFDLEFGSGELETLMDRISEDSKIEEVMEQLKNLTVEEEKKLAKKRVKQQAMPEPFNEGTSSTILGLELTRLELKVETMIDQISQRLDKLEKLLESKYDTRKRNKSEVSAALTKSLSIVDTATSPVKRPKPSTKKPPADTPTQPRPNNDSEIMADTTPVPRKKPAGRRQKSRSNLAQK